MKSYRFCWDGFSLTHAQMGYSRTRAPMGRGGGFRPPLLLSAKLPGRFSMRKRHLIASGLNFPKMWQNCICGVNDDVTGRIKDKFSIFCPCWLRRAKQPYQIETKPSNDKDRVWDTSKYPPKSVVTLCQMKVRIKYQNIEKGQIKNLEFGWCDTFLGSDIRQESEKWP